MTFNNLDTEGMNFEEGRPPEESSNRTFIIVASILGGLTLLILVCIAIYAFVISPRQRASREQEIAERNAQNTQIALAITQTSEAIAAQAEFTDTPTVTPIPSTPTRTPTPVLAVPTNTTAATADPRTATVAALLTQADEVGIPGLLGIAILLIAVIFLARRLRISTSS